MMNYEEFKEKFTEDLKTNLEAKGHKIASVDSKDDGRPNH